MNELGSGPKLEIQPGVVFECLVGAHNQSRGLTTGIVRFEAGVKLARHTHPTTESITLLEGAAALEVDGRRYRLSPFSVGPITSASWPCFWSRPGVWLCFGAS